MFEDVVVICVSDVLFEFEWIYFLFNFVYFCLRGGMVF